MLNLPPEIKEWLNERGITDEVLHHNNIGFADNHIVIPVYSPMGEFLFNKYRRSPFSDEGPKYRYDKGATTALYNVNNIFLSDEVFIVEGELDALALQSKGYFAVSTTGGSGSFNPEWASLLNTHKIVYICYDNDDAGMRGTIKVLRSFPFAQVVEIPQEPGIKDITDFLKKYPTGLYPLLINSDGWALPFETESDDLKEMKKATESCKNVAERLQRERQVRLENNIDVTFVDLLLQYVRDRYDVYNNKIRKKKKPTVRTDGDDILKARSVPITQYLEFNSEKFALCINHREHTPSMKYYPRNNKVKCFGCGFNGDTIDVVQKLFGLAKGDAIKKIIT